MCYDRERCMASERSGARERVGEVLGVSIDDILSLGTFKFVWSLHLR